MRLFVRQPEPDLDRQGLLLSQQVLGVSEYNLFEHSYMAWYGVKAREQELERYYIDYLVNGRMPGWLRQYSRRICREHTIENQHRLAGHDGGSPWLRDMLLLALLLGTIVLFAPI